MYPNEIPLFIMLVLFTYLAGTNLKGIITCLSYACNIIKIKIYYLTIITFQVGGSFHIAPGKSFTINHIHVHDVQPYSSSVFNTTHYIKHLSFGTDIKAANTAPLDGVNGVAKEGEGWALFLALFISEVVLMVQEGILTFPCAYQE